MNKNYFIVKLYVIIFFRIGLLSCFRVNFMASCCKDADVLIVENENGKCLGKCFKKYLKEMNYYDMKSFERNDNWFCGSLKLKLKFDRNLPIINGESLQFSFYVSKSNKDFRLINYQCLKDLGNKSDENLDKIQIRLKIGNFSSLYNNSGCIFLF